MTGIKILNVKTIMDLYGLTKADTYEILRSKGCPLIKGGEGKKYLIEQSAFEDFITRRNA